LEEMKARPLEERVKTAMTTDEPRVLCISVFDNGPVHLLDTIHRSAEMVTVYKARWDHLSQSKKKTPMRLLSIINDYNHNMNNVDRRDHLSHEYNLDGGFWRDRKWWMPIFKELFKSNRRGCAQSCGNSRRSLCAQRKCHRTEAIAEGFVIEASFGASTGGTPR